MKRPVIKYYRLEGQNNTSHQNWYPLAAFYEKEKAVSTYVKCLRGVLDSPDWWRFNEFRLITKEENILPMNDLESWRY